MRRERLYSSMLSSWRKQRDQAAEGGGECPELCV